MLDKNPYKEILRKSLNIDSELVSLIKSLEMFISNKELKPADKTNLFIMKQYYISLTRYLKELNLLSKRLAFVGYETRKDIFYNYEESSKNKQKIKIDDKNILIEGFNKSGELIQKFLDESKETDSFPKKILESISYNFLYFIYYEFMELLRLQDKLSNESLMKVITKDKFIEE